MQARLVDRAVIAANTAAFMFEPDGPFAFTPGQTCDITIPDPLYRDDAGASRTFSIASLPSDPRLMIGTRLRGSAMKRTLMEAPLPLAVEIDGPFGSFTLHRNAARPAVFLAGGIGITPFHCIIGDAAVRHLPHSLTLFYSNRSAADVAWLPDLESWARENPRFRLVATLTQPKPGDDWHHEVGLVDAAMLSRHMQLERAGDTIFYIAGPGGFVKAMQALLPGIGADPDNIRAEEFPGY
jgi:ferredoxin-NADP reductase